MLAGLLFKARVLLPDLFLQIAELPTQGRSSYNNLGSKGFNKKEQAKITAVKTVLYFHRLIDHFHKDLRHNSTVNPSCASPTEMNRTCRMLLSKRLVREVSHTGLFGFFMTLVLWLSCFALATVLLENFGVL